MKIAIEDCQAQIYIDGQLTDVRLTIEVDTDNLNEVARRAWHKADGIATWAEGVFSAYLSDVAVNAGYAEAQ